MKTGAEYCKTMALAAVVNLLAVMNNVKTKDRNIPAETENLLTTKGVSWMRMKIKYKIADMRLLIPAIAMGFQGNNLKKIPAVLHRKAHITIYKIDRFLGSIPHSSFWDQKIIAKS